MTHHLVDNITLLSSRTMLRYGIEALASIPIETQGEEIFIKFMIFNTKVLKIDEFRVLGKSK
jgi:hypothetical protein